MTKMNLFRMEGAWTPVLTAVYNRCVTPALIEIYEENLNEYFPSEMVEAGMRVLDVGCGAGHMLSIIDRRHPQLDLVGIDLSEEMIGRARKENRGRPNLFFRTGNALGLPFAPESFDFIISLASIKHWPDQARGTAELFRVMRPGAGLFILEADRSCTREAARAFVSRWRFLTPMAKLLATEYFVRFVAGQGVGAWELEKLCLEAGFAKLEAKALTDYPGVVVRGMKPE